MREGQFGPWSVLPVGDCVTSDESSPGLLNTRIAGKLREEIQGSKTGYLPSLRELSTRYGVAFRTMQKALHLLRKEGLLDFSQGKRVRIVQAAAPSQGLEDAEFEPSASRLCRRLKTAIETGKYRVGQTLPKTKYFVLSENLGDHTVAEALKMLKADNLVHKRGKKWVVGPAPSPKASLVTESGQPTRRDVVLLLVPNDLSWFRLFRATLMPMGNALFEELYHHGVELVLVQRDDNNPCRRFFATGRSEILECVNSLGNRYRGTVIVAQVHQFPDLEEWINWLCQFNQPVVWLDYDNAAPHVDRRRIPRSNYYRCYSDETSCVREVLDRVYQLGHRVIGVPQFEAYLSDGWAVRRTRAIQEHVEGYNPKPIIVSTMLLEKLWEKDVVKDNELIVMFNYVNDTLNDLRRKHPGLSETRLRNMHREELVGAVPSLASLITQHEATVIIGMNQKLAVNYYYWLRNVGVSIPDDVSLVSFDNIPILGPHPISSVDFRRNALGYSAAHIFIRDIPVKADRQGNIGAGPEYLDRGSLAPPRRGGLSLAGVQTGARKKGR